MNGEGAIEAASTTGAATAAALTVDDQHQPTTEASHAEKKRLVARSSSRLADADMTAGDDEQFHRGTPGDDLANADMTAGDDEIPEEDPNSDQDAEYVLTEKQRQEGAQFATTKYANLTLTFSIFAAELMNFWGKTQGVGETGPNSHNAPPDIGIVADMIHDWRAEIQKLGKNCSPDPMDVPECMGVTRCMLEPEVGGTVSQAFFANFMEMEDSIVANILPDFETFSRNSVMLQRSYAQVNIMLSRPPTTGPPRPRTPHWSRDIWQSANVQQSLQLWQFSAPQNAH